MFSGGAAILDCLGPLSIKHHSSSGVMVDCAGVDPLVMTGLDSIGSGVGTCSSVVGICHHQPNLVLHPVVMHPHCC